MGPKRFKFGQAEIFRQQKITERDGDFLLGYFPSIITNCFMSIEGASSTLRCWKVGGLEQDDVPIGVVDVCGPDLSTRLHISPAQGERQNILTCGNYFQRIGSDDVAVAIVRSQCV